MDLKVSLKSENGLLNFLKKKIKEKKNIFLATTICRLMMAPFGAIWCLMMAQK
jgi:hypothetical protein